MEEESVKLKNELQENADRYEETKKELEEAKVTHGTHMESLGVLQVEIAQLREALAEAHSGREVAKNEYEALKKALEETKEAFEKEREETKSSLGEAEEAAERQGVRVAELEQELTVLKGMLYT